MSATAEDVPRLRRDRDHAVVAGICSGLARHFGVDPLLMRVLAVGAAAAGPGVPAYLIAWAVIPATGDARPAIERLPSRRSAELGAGIACLVLAALLALRELGFWFGDAVVWPVVLFAGGGALIWRQAQGRAEPQAQRPAAARAGERSAVAQAPPIQLDPRKLPGTLVGAALVVLGAFVFLALNGALASARDVVLPVTAALVAAALILAPWWLRLVRNYTAERAERVRTQERAEIAAHLHDSVLQTLALVQRRADDPRAVAQLARAQERELRAWLDRDRAPGEAGATFAAALDRAAEEVEAAHGAEVEVVTVGDVPLDARVEAIVAAAREAMTNAAKFAPGEPVRVYAEADGGRLQVFVRDRGPGFDPATVPEDRRGVRESIIGRMERHGGSAKVHTAPGQGTEVELTL